MSNVRYNFKKETVETVFPRVGDFFEATYSGERYLFYRTWDRVSYDGTPKYIVLIEVTSHRPGWWLESEVRIMKDIRILILLKPGTVNNLVHSFEVDIEVSTAKDEESDSSCYACYGYESEEEYEESGCKDCYE